MDELEEKCRKGNWLVVPMETLRGHSMIELRSKWRSIMRNLEKGCAGHKTARTDSIGEAEMTLEDSLLIYWRLPDLIRRRRQWGRPLQIWLRSYDVPLMQSLARGFSRAATVFVEELVESCLEELQAGEVLYLTGQMPFALQRLGIYPNWPELREVDETQRRLVRDMLHRHFIRSGKGIWRTWLEYLEGRFIPGTFLSSESPDQEGGWQMLVDYCGLEEEIPMMIRETLERGRRFRGIWRDSRELRGRIEDMIRLWECKDVKEIEELVCLMIYCHVIEATADSALTSLVGGGKIGKNSSE